MAVKPKLSFPIALAEWGGKYMPLVWNRHLNREPVGKEGDMVVLTLNGQEDLPPFSELQTLVVTDGGYFENVKLALTFTTAATQRDVPVGVPDRLNPAEEGQDATVRTWAQWAQANRQEAIRKVSGTGPDYVMKAANGTTLLNSTELVAAAGVSGVGVIDWSTAKAYYSSENYEKL